MNQESNEHISLAANPHKPLPIVIYRNQNVVSTGSSRGRAGYCPILEQESERAVTPPLRRRPSDPVSGMLTQDSDGMWVIKPKDVIGDDDREKVNATDEYPWSPQAYLWITFPDGTSGIGSGTFISQRHVLTAGHCLYKTRYGGWAEAVECVPGKNGIDEPFGVADAVRLFAASEWIADESREYDYGLILLDSDIGEQTGWFAVGWANDAFLATRLFYLAAYGKDGDQDGLWYQSERIAGVQARIVRHVFDTDGGQSGAAIWASTTEVELALAVHTAGADTVNLGTRITEAAFHDYVRWMESE